ncbi:hypothetical protein, partial [Pseudomonas sp.]|uniref:hypothetical protein n=1 Tax=Pseudomonas sp. TaxID=306 RepID=UPI0028AFD77F
KAVGASLLAICREPAAKSDPTVQQADRDRQVCCCFAADRWQAELLRPAGRIKRMIVADAKRRGGQR